MRHHTRSTVVSRLVSALLRRSSAACRMDRRAGRGTKGPYQIVQRGEVRAGTTRGVSSSSQLRLRLLRMAVHLDNVHAVPLYLLTRSLARADSNANIYSGHESRAAADLASHKPLVLVLCQHVRSLLSCDPQTVAARCLCAPASNLHHQLQRRSALNHIVSGLLSIDPGTRAFRWRSSRSRFWPIFFDKPPCLHRS